VSTGCYLRMGGDALLDAERCRSLAVARATYMAAARELDRYGQKITATVHIAASLTTAAEYPDYLLELGPRGGLQSTRL